MLRSREEVYCDGGWMVSVLHWISLSTLKVSILRKQTDIRIKVSQKIIEIL